MPTTYIPLTTTGEGAEVGAGAEGVIMVAEGNNFLVKRKNNRIICFPVIRGFAFDNGGHMSSARK